MNVNAWIAAFVLSLGAAFIGVGFFQYGVQYVGAQDAAILSTFEPVTSMIVGILVLHEECKSFVDGRLYTDSYIRDGNCVR